MTVARLCRTGVFLGVFVGTCLCWAGRPGYAADGESLKEETKKVDDVTFTSLKLDVKNVLPCLVWADAKGSAFLVLDGGTGVLRRVSTADFTVVKEKELGRKMTWLSPCADGVLVSADNGEVWLLDADTFETKKKLPVPDLKRAVSCSGSSVAFAGTLKGNELYILDLKGNRVMKVNPPSGLERGSFIDPVLSPDGKYLFTGSGIGNVNRFQNAEGKLTFVDKIRLHAGTGLAICVSADSRFVCQPAGGGNPDAGGSYRTIVFPIDTFSKKECILEPGAYPKPVGWDPVANLIYTGNGGTGLIVFSTTGIKKKEYKIGKSTQQRQYLAHPEGYKVLILTQEKLLFAELPR
jgi:hypothetical protein